MGTKTARRRYVTTQWEWATYDVWGNARDGYEVNDVYRRREPVELRLEVKTYNAGSEHEFDSAYPSTKQIRQVFGVRCQLDLQGDDLTVYVNRERDLYPIGELHCTSHDSLSPIREKSQQQ